MKRPFPNTLVPLSILGLVFLLFLLPLPQGWAQGWRGELTNRLHAPLMAVCLVTAARLLGQFQKPLPSLVLAVTVAVALAALIEWVQPWFGRTASLDDFLWGMTGVLGGCLWQCAGLLPSLSARVPAWILAVVCALAPPFLWFTQVTLVRADARRIFPVLAESTHARMQLLWTIEPSPGENVDAQSSLKLSRDGAHPGSMHLDTLDRDWSGFAGLEISGTLKAKAAVEVGVRLDVGEDGGKRIRTGGWMQPGDGVIQISWPKDAPRPRVHQLVVFLAAHPEAAELEIHRLRLIETKEMEAK
ncbi:hypothetical protein [Prosthecobacter sp.]|uniref:hypothetical protein n=1 Tax=Prosthecobacter sp. TaxID=1965333 RepID=UPI00378422CC